MKKKIIRLVFIVLIVSIVGTFFINVYMVKKTQKQIIEEDKVQELKDVDAILILGCKVHQETPSMMLKNRLDKGISVYQKLHTKILVSGDHGKNDYDEVRVMKNYLLQDDVKEEDIFMDHAGFSTYDSLYRVKNVFLAKKIIIVTQEYHLPRALFLANKLGIEAYGVSALDIPYQSIMLKNEIREILSRDKNFFKGIIKPKSKYVGEVISLKQDGRVTEDVNK